MRVRPMNNGRIVMWMTGMAAVVVLSPAVPAAVVTIDTNVHYQTIAAYGAASWMPPWITPELRVEILNELANEFGINRLRLEIPSGNGQTKRRWEQFNDNNDPERLNWPAMNLEDFDRQVRSVILPLREIVLARGEPFDVYVSPSFFDGGSTGEVPVWLLRNRGEYAEFTISLLRRLKETHGIEADWYCILNEAGNLHTTCALAQ